MQCGAGSGVGWWIEDVDDGLRVVQASLPSQQAAKFNKIFIEG